MVFSYRSFSFVRRLARRRIVFLLGIISLVVVWLVKGYLNTTYIKIENADFPNVGDFSCDRSLKKTSCTFVSNRRNLEAFGVKICNSFGVQCKGFVANQGMKTVTLKQMFHGKNSFAAGMTTFIKKTYISLINITEMFETCADSLKMDDHTSKNSEKRKCNLANLDPFDKSIMGVMFKPDRFTCSGENDLTLYENGKLRINPELKEIVSEVLWQVIKVKPNDGSKFILSSSGILNAGKPQVVINEDMVRVDVTTRSGRKQTDFHLKISPKPDVLKRPTKRGLSSVNVIMIGLDSTAHSHFQRKLGKVYKFLKYDLKSFIFNGYSVVGDGTTPALLALLTGRKEEELPEGRHRMKGAKCLDDWPWIFKDFQRNGYATMFNEDEVDLGAFTYRLMGFCNPPMDHYLLPYWYAGISAITPWFKINLGSLKGHCIGSQAIHNVSLEMIRSMYEAYPKTPKFGMSFFSDICHSRLNDLSLMEDDLLSFLKLMKERNYLDNTILITFGDHGIRFGSIRSTVIGKMEERLPFLSISVPVWFKDTYPDFVANLHDNVDVLSSPLDVHATLGHILSYPSVPTEKGYGRSLFAKLGDRVCEETGIPTHFCPCMEWIPVDVNHDHVKKSAQAILDHINNLIKNENLLGKCALLSLKEIKSAVKVTPNEDVQTFEKSADQDGRKASKGTKPKGVCHYQLQIHTMPNNGIFESTVQLSSGSVMVNKQMSRIDRYGDQPKCIVETHHHMREYCYCR